MTLFTEKTPLREQWIHHLTRDDREGEWLRRQVNVATRKYLCLSHFGPEAFITSPTHHMLKPDATPKNHVSLSFSKNMRKQAKMYNYGT